MKKLKKAKRKAVPQMIKKTERKSQGRTKPIDLKVPRNLSSNVTAPEGTAMVGVTGKSGTKSVIGKGENERWYIQRRW